MDCLPVLPQFHLNRIQLKVQNPVYVKTKNMFFCQFFTLSGSFKFSIYNLVVENGCKLLANTSVPESVELFESLGEDDEINSSLTWN
jgi:hypothetical protein